MEDARAPLVYRGFGSRENVVDLARLFEEPFDEERYPYAFHPGLRGVIEHPPADHPPVGVPRTAACELLEGRTDEVVPLEQVPFVIQSEVEGTGEGGLS